MVDVGTYNMGCVTNQSGEQARMQHEETLYAPFSTASCAASTTPGVSDFFSFICLVCVDMIVESLQDDTGGVSHGKEIGRVD